MTLLPDALPAPAAAANRRPAPRPLAPLTAGEVATATRVLRAELSLSPTARFTAIALHQSSPEIVARQPEGAIDRDAIVVVADPDLEATYEAVVAVDEGFLRSFRRRPSR